MKKILLITLLLLSIGAIGVNYTTTSTKEIPRVSENPSIPHFIDTMMKNERAKVFLAKENKLDTRLLELGFSAKARSAADYQTMTTMKKLYSFYDKLYPGKQFVNFKCIDQLMKRYGLKLGALSSYIGPVPEDRLTVMEGFIKYRISRLDGFRDLSTSMEEMAAENMGYGSFSVLTEGDMDEGWAETYRKYLPSRAAFFILAPSSYFEGEPNDKGNYGWVKDPIVISPVYGGYIIVTAW